jgi:hypothetical protein
LVENLSKQVYFYSIDTSAFYDDEEEKIHKKLMRVYLYRSKITKLKNKLLAKNDDEIDKDKVTIYFEKHFQYISKRIIILKGKLDQLFDKHKGIRQLRPDSLNDNQVISIFDSILTRTLQLGEELSDSIIIVRSYYYNILNNIICNGFMKNGEKYIYFTSSAGQIRTKKCVFMKESIWEKYKGTLTCGLSMEEINEKGGVNTNKYQAYMALSNSASVEWTDFDINKSIVVNGLETDVHCMVDYIDKDTYVIDRKEMDVPIEHTDGCGMILPSLSDKCFMVRLPFVKGLLVPFDFKKFCEEEKGNTKIKDIYGKVWDIIEDDIQVIFTKSQFKMYGYYDSWDDYKNKFIKNNCQAAKMNEEDVSGHARLNYQMLQTLTDMTNKELKELSKDTVSDILKLGSDRKTMLKVLGATDGNPNKNYFQNALLLYPELLNDNYARLAIKNKKKRMVKEARSGKLDINGKYTFIIPDLYAFCEYLFKNIKVPKGLLSNNEVYCDLYQEGKVDLLRSPHLYREHGVRNNIINEEKQKWFITHGVYTSTYDPISKILMFDNDGDKVIIVQDELFVSIAERNMKGIVPLYYEMAKAEASELSYESIYAALRLAYKENIGAISNNITKIWNSEDILTNPDALNCIKWLCLVNNFTIDFAKTLFMPEPPKDIKKKIDKYIKGVKLPNFFIYAKDKETDKVDKANNSVVNRLRKIVPNKRIHFEEIAESLDYHNLMFDKDTPLDSTIIEKYNWLNRHKNILITDKMYIKKDDQLFLYKKIREELLNINSDSYYVADVLVKWIYEKNKSQYHTTLWESFGKELLTNLKRNLKGTKLCIGCGKRINGGYKDKRKYCNDCASIINREKTKNNMRKSRNV